MITAEVDMTGYNRALAGLSDAFIGQGQYSDAATIIEDEAARVAATLIKDAPPKSLAQGRKAISNDLKRLIGTADTDTIKMVTREHGTENIDGYITAEDGRTIRLKWEKVTTDQGVLAQIHKKYRNKRGKVSRSRTNLGSNHYAWYRRVVTTNAARNRYIRTVQKKVGHLKGSVAKTLVTLKVHVANWIAKKAALNPNGIVDISGLRNRARPTIAFGSNAPGAIYIKDNINRVLRIRIAAMKKRTKLVMSGYSADMRRGLRPKRRARRQVTNASV